MMVTDTIVAIRESLPDRYRLSYDIAHHAGQIAIRPASGSEYILRSCELAEFLRSEGFDASEGCGEVIVQVGWDRGE